MQKWMILFLLFLAACTAQQPQEPTDVAAIRGAPMPTDNDVRENPSQTQPPAQTTTVTSSAFTGRILAGTTTPYIAFNQADYETALKTKKIIVLDFYANWCPICKREEPEIIAAFNQLDDPNIIGFRVNYKDSETDDYEEALARQQGIAYQHTKVILIEGRQALKSPESWNTERWITEIKGASNG